MVGFALVLVLLAAACSSETEQSTITSATTVVSTTSTTDTDESTTSTAAATTEETATTTTTTTAGAGSEQVEAPDCEYGGKIQKIEALGDYTVRFTMCDPEPAFPQIAASVAFGIQPKEHLEATGGAPLDDPVGTGPFRLEEWRRGESIVFAANPDYWGDPPEYDTLVFRWNPDGGDRLTELQTGKVDQISGLLPEDFDTVGANPDLEILRVVDPNTLYLGITAQVMDDPDDPEDTVYADARVREAIARGIDRQQIVEEFYPDGSEVASHFTPCSIPNGCAGEEWYEFDREEARQLLIDAGLGGGFETTLYYREVYRAYLPDPAAIALAIQTQLADNLGITAEVVVMESDEFIDDAINGRLDGMYLLGWGARIPHTTGFLDVHFNEENLQFGTPDPDIYQPLERAARIADPADAADTYAEANNAIRDLVPMVPIAHSASGSAALAAVDGTHIRPFGAPLFEKVNPGKDTFVWMQAAEPESLYCTDENDGASLAACQQVVEPLLGYAIDSGEVEPRLATGCTGNGNATVWTCSLRQGVVFHDGSDFDAEDVVASWSAAIWEGDALHVGNTGTFRLVVDLLDALIPAADT